MMKLHLDKYAFDTIISNISKRSNVRRDILEKDYYVTLILNELSKRENQGYAYFKVGIVHIRFFILSKIQVLE